METPQERKKRLAQEASRRFREKNPGYDTAAAQKRRAKPGGTTYKWPAQRANGLRVTEYKSTTPCTDCKKIYPPECMDFDHVRGDKTNNVGTMVTHGWSWEKIQTEIDKCELVCSNCHRIRTRKRRLEKRGN